MKYVIIESRVTLCRLAECALAFESQNTRPGSKSALLAQIVDALAATLRQNNVVPAVEDEEVAIGIVRRVIGPQTFDPSALTFNTLQQQVQKHLQKGE